MTDPRDPLVAGQYEAYPYPDRSPTDEKKRLIEGSPSDLRELSHYLFRGGMPNPFRALIAGGGTGDAAIMLAQHCASAGLEAEIVYLDMSATARAVVEARANVRGLDNLRFATGSLLEVAGLAPGPYDYIDCCGVLHHLEVPEDGLRALVQHLKPGGGMGLMVYGEYGRRGVYETQALLRQLAPPDRPGTERLAQTRRLLDALPRTHWLKRNPFVQDHKAAGDAGLYDLLLHARDRAYTVPQLADLVSSAGLGIAAFIEPARYDPATYLRDPRLLAPLAALPPIEQAAAAEALAGNLRKHVVYVAAADRATSCRATPADRDLVPILRRHAPEALAKALRAGHLSADLDGFPAKFPAPPRAAAIAQRLDGRRSVAEIVADLRDADPGLSQEKAAEAFDALYRVLNGLNLLFLSGRRG